jgi:hypothetical protein
LHSFYDFQHIKNLRITLITRLLKKAAEKQDEKRIWQMWLSQYPYMTKDTFVPYSEFLDEIKRPVMSIRPAAEILKEVQEIREKMQSPERR